MITSSLFVIAAGAYETHLLLKPCSPKTAAKLGKKPEDICYGDTTPTLDESRNLIFKPVLYICLAITLSWAVGQMKAVFDEYFPYVMVDEKKRIKTIFILFQITINMQAACYLLNLLIL